MHKPGDTSTIDCILHSHTFVLLSCLLPNCIHLAWVFECLFMLAMDERILITINRVYERESSGTSRETSLILDPRNSTNNILNRRGKKLRQFIRKKDQKKEKKNNRCCKALCVNTQTPKFEKIFGNICTLIRFILLEHFKLYSSSCDLLEVLVAAGTHFHVFKDFVFFCERFVLRKCFVCLLPHKIITSLLLME